MEPIQKIKLPVPYKQTEKALKKVGDKLKSLKKTGTEKILTFAGSNEVEAMFYLYLFKKYKSNCFLHDKNLGRRILGMSILISETYEPQDVKETQDQLDSLSKILLDCITNLDTKIIIVPVQLRFSDGGAHANVLIYRKNLNQIEHFEPHGRKFSSDDDDVDNKIIEKWMNLFVLKINARLQLIKRPQVKLIESSEVCPYIDGLQNLEGWSSFSIIAGVEPPGYCVAWSMFFTELCLKNPQVPSSVLMNYIFQFLQDNMTIAEKRNYLRSVIRGYSVFINEKINKYFSVFFNYGLTIQKIKALSGPQLNSFRSILRDLIDIEMNLTTNPLFLTSSLKRMQNKLTHLNEGLKLNSSDDAIKKEIIRLTNKKKLFEIYNKVKFSNPTESISYSSLTTKFCPEGKEINPKTGRCVKTKTQKVKLEKVKVEPGLLPESVSKSCPEGKEINPKTGRCVKIKTQKVKKMKIPKMKTSKVTIPKVVIKLEPVLEPVLQPKIKMTKSCPQGKEINPKTGRCVKIKTQKVKISKKKMEELEQKHKTCPQGKKINPKTGRCVKIKTQKVKISKKKMEKLEQRHKTCPEGKEINPKTGRCVKTKTQKIRKIKMKL
jgi:hypothetical protein